MKKLASLFWEFAKIGLFTIGGGLAMIPLIKEEICVKKKWLSEEELVDAVAVCQSLPGVIAVNMAGYVGYRLKNLSGAIFATLGVISPSFVIIIVLSGVLAHVGENKHLEFVMQALRVASAALIFSAAISIGQKTVKDFFGVMLAVMSFVAVAFFKLEVYVVLLIAVLMGVMFKYKREE